MPDPNKQQENQDLILQRVSIRNYSDEPVSDADVQRLLRAAMAAPSACNQQPWEFWVVRGSDRLFHLSLCSAFARPTRKAAVAIVACMKTSKDEIRVPEMAPQDMGACMENLLLEATQMGLGAVWQGIYPDPKRMDKVAKLLGIEDREDLVPFSIVALGHPAQHPTPTGPDRFDPSRIHEELA